MNPVRMFTTQVCPYCVRAKALLKQRGVEAIDEIRVDLHPEKRAEMIAETGRRTVPQIFIGDTWVRLRRPDRARPARWLAAPARGRLSVYAAVTKRSHNAAAARTVPVAGFVFSGTRHG